MGTNIAGGDFLGGKFQAGNILGEGGEGGEFPRTIIDVQYLNQSPCNILVLPKFLLKVTVSRLEVHYHYQQYINCNLKHSSI